MRNKYLKKRINKLSSYKTLDQKLEYIYAIRQWMKDEDEATKGRRLVEMDEKIEELSTYITR